MELRNYQIQAINKIKIAFSKGKNRIILCSPTGSGKTVIFSKIASLTTQNNKKVLIATDRKELLTQTGNKLSDFDIDFSILTAKTKKIPKNKAVVCMLETLKVRLKKQNYKDFVNNFDLIILDECHKNSFNRLFDSISQSQRVIGASATPYRTGKMPELKEFYDEIIEVISIPELIELQFLSKPLTYGIPQDLKEIKIKMGDYDSEQLSNYYQKKEVFTGIVPNIKKHSFGKKTLVFCVSIANSMMICDELCKSGLNAKHLDSTMNDSLRSEILNWYSITNEAVLCNVGILTTGFDSPDTECIVLYRATKSLPLFLQMCGRGSRVTKTKKSFLILDFGNNIAEHGFWEDERIWNLENAKKGKKKNKLDVSPVKNCPECEAIIHLSAKKCSYCGYIYPSQEKTAIEVLLSKLSPSEIQRYAEDCNVRELEEIRENKGYKIGWVLHRLKNYEQFLQYEKLKNYKTGWAKFNYNRYGK